MRARLDLADVDEESLGKVQWSGRVLQERGRWEGRGGFYIRVHVHLSLHRLLLGSSVGARRLLQPRWFIPSRRVQAFRATTQRRLLHESKDGWPQRSMVLGLLRTRPASACRMLQRFRSYIGRWYRFSRHYTDGLPLCFDHLALRGAESDLRLVHIRNKHFLSHADAVVLVTRVNG